MVVAKWYRNDKRQLDLVLLPFNMEHKKRGSNEPLLINQLND